MGRLGALAAICTEEHETQIVPWARKVNSGKRSNNDINKNAKGTSSWWSMAFEGARAGWEGRGAKTWRLCESFSGSFSSVLSSGSARFLP